MTKAGRAERSLGSPECSSSSRLPLRRKTHKTHFFLSVKIVFVLNSLNLKRLASEHPVRLPANCRMAKLSLEILQGVNLARVLRGIALVHPKAKKLRDFAVYVSITVEIDKHPTVNFKRSFVAVQTTLQVFEVNGWGLWSVKES